MIGPTARKKRLFYKKLFICIAILLILFLIVFSFPLPESIVETTVYPVK